jgi:lipid-A-disaccharide synthase-like uncharacterized protein
MSEILFTIPYWGDQTVLVTAWKIMGWCGCLLFTGRWIVQMHYSRKAQRVVMPRLYWVMSIMGSVMLLSYFTFSPQRGTVGFLSNIFPVFVASYNLYLDLTHTFDRTEISNA